MTDQVITEAAQEIIVKTDDQEAIIKFATELSESIINQELSFNVAFNGITTSLTALMLDYSIEDGNSLNLEKVQKTYQYFMQGLEHSLKGAIDKIKADSQQVKDMQAELVAG